MNDIEALKGMIRYFENEFAAKYPDAMKAMRHKLADLEKASRPKWEVWQDRNFLYYLKQSKNNLSHDSPEYRKFLQSIADKLNAAEDGVVNQAQFDKAYNEAIDAAVKIASMTGSYYSEMKIRNLKRPI